MKLIDILKDINYELIKGDINIEVEDINYDSRAIKNNYAFVAMHGIDADGHDYIDKALSNGANCLIVEKDINVDADVTIVKLDDTRKSLSKLSSNLFRNPADELIKIAITGTKGKTTSSWMIKSVLEANGDKVGVIGTIGTYVDGILHEHKNTTPESYLVQKYLREMVDAGCKYLVMEVSSQAMKVGRVSNIFYDYAIFSNLSFDHVGEREHPTFEDYYTCKAKLFNQCKKGILNIDDEYYKEMVKNATCEIYSYGKNGKDLIIDKVNYFKDSSFLGIEFNTKGLVNEAFKVSCPGLFSVYNAASVILLANLLGINNETIYKGLANFVVAGRCEIINLKNGVKAIIDYAHNNLSMESIINSMKEYNDGRIVSIFGCGGGRAPQIRYELGKVVGMNSDYSIITSDNPRNDDLSEINKDIEKGMLDVNADYKIIPNREDAIRFAIENALDNDIILIMGKGHEKFEEVKGTITPFDERAIVESYL